MWFISLGHFLAVEVLRHKDRRYQPYIPREWRPCRFGCNTIEDEFHALLCCSVHSALVDHCCKLLDSILTMMPGFAIWTGKLESRAFMEHILFDEALLPIYI